MTNQRKPAVTAYPQRFPRGFMLIAGILIALTALVFVSRERHEPTPLEELAERSAELRHRSFRPRLAGPFTYAPLAKVSRGHAVDTDLSPEALNLRLVASQYATSGDPHLAGVSSLLGGEYENATKQLRRAAERESAESWSDLSAALLVESEKFGTIVPVLDALTAADHALRLDGRQAPAAFNRAIALEILGLLDEASEAWKRYRAIDSLSSWSIEAAAAEARIDAQLRGINSWRRMLPQLEEAIRRRDTVETRRIVIDHPRDARAWGEAVYTANWAEAFKAGDTKRAEQELDRSRFIGEALRETGEQLLADSVRVIDDSPLHGRTLLAEAYLSYRVGRIDYSKRATTAVARLHKAEELFSRGRSPMAAVARYYVGSALYSEQRLKEALAILDKLAEEQWTQRGYIALAAQIGWERGLATLARGSYTAAAKIFADSETLFERVRDQENAAMMRDFQATTFDLAGDAERAWRIRRFVFRQLAHLGDATRKITALNGAATAFIARREWARGRSFLDLAIAAATREKDDPKLSSALAQRSAVLAALGERTAARRDLDDLQKHLSSITEPEARAGLQVDADYAEALLAGDANPELAIRYLTLAIRQLDDAGRALFLSRVHLERSRAYKRRGDLESARADILTGLDWIERNRHTIADPQLRAMTLGSAQELFHEGVSIALAAGDRKSAFDFAERAHARSLLESFDRQVAATQVVPMSVAMIQEFLQPSAAVVDFVLIQDRLITFVVTSRNFLLFDVRIPPEELRDTIAAAAASVRNRRDRKPLERAWNLFMKPLDDALEGVNAIAIVPDPELRSVPFVALYNPQRQRFAIEDYVMSIAPSASLAVRCSVRAAHAGGMSALVVAATDFDHSLFPDLAPLEWVTSEARMVCSSYAHSRQFAGADATPGAVTRAFLQADIVHFCGHSLSRLHEPTESALILSPERSESTLTAGDIGRLNMQGTRLVVLSSCRSAVTGNWGDGIEGLASAFVMAGVPSVLGTMWDVDDRGAADFSVAFHRQYRTHGDAARAFRDVVLQTNSTGVPQWTVVTLFGGFPGLIREEERE